MHFGYPGYLAGQERERLFCRWLDTIKPDATELYLLGDIFDFWYEYKRVIPKGFTRFLGKIAEFTDSGIPVHFFTGNHDVWMFKYFQDELGVILHTNTLICDIDGRKFFMDHGDGLGINSLGLKFMNWCFNNKCLQWMFATLLHPNFSQWIGHKWSGKSRESKAFTHQFNGEDEAITKFARKTLQTSQFDYFIFGHNHSPVIYNLSPTSKLVILGDWLQSNTYAVWDGKTMRLNTFR